MILDTGTVSACLTKWALIFPTYGKPITGALAVAWLEALQPYGLSDEEFRAASKKVMAGPEFPKPEDIIKIVQAARNEAAWRGRGETAWDIERNQAAMALESPMPTDEEIAAIRERHKHLLQDRPKVTPPQDLKTIARRPQACPRGDFKSVGDTLDAEASKTP